MLIKKLLILLSSVFAIVFFIFFIRTYTNQQLKKRWDVTDEQYEKILQKDELAAHTKNFNIRNVRVYDFEYKELVLQELLQNKQIVILKYSSFNCSDCIEHALSHLQKHENLIGLQNVIVLIEFRNERESLIFKQIESLHPKIFFTYEKLGLPVEELDLPFVIVTDSSLLPLKVFIPMKEFPERTNQYFIDELIHF